MFTQLWAHLTDAGNHLHGQRYAHMITAIDWWRVRLKESTQVRRFGALLKCFVKFNKIVDRVVVCFLQQTVHDHIDQSDKVFILPYLNRVLFGN